MKDLITFYTLGCHVRGCFCRVTRSAYFARRRTIVACCDDHDPNNFGEGGPLPRIAAEGYVAETPGVAGLWIDYYVPERPAALGGPADGPSGGQRVRPVGPRAPRPGGGGAAVQLVAGNVRLTTAGAR